VHRPRHVRMFADAMASALRPVLARVAVIADD
jgi:hypothetical protein